MCENEQIGNEPLNGPTPAAQPALNASLSPAIESLADDGVQRRANERLLKLTEELAEARLTAETATRETEALHRTLEEHYIISIADASGRIVSVNDAFCKISGYSREELIGQDHRIINSGTHPKSFWVDLWKTIANGKAWRGDICNRAKDGSLYWVDSIIAPFRRADGKIAKYVSIRIDITERRRSERNLIENAQRLGLAAKTANMGVWDWDLVTRRVRWDRMMFEIYGVVPTDDNLVDYSTWASAVVPEELAEQEELLKDTIKRCGRGEREFRIKRSDGAIRVIQSAEKVLSNQNGEPVMVVGVNRDVTSQREGEAKLTESLTVIARQNAELAAMAERAHRVVDDVSHEFRTPLAAIKEFVSIISDGLAGPVTPQQFEYLKIIDGAVVDLNHMVEDLLDSSKLRSGRLRVDRWINKIDSIFAAGRTSLARKASSRAITIEESIQDNLPEIFADEEKVRRVISNLLTNAIKFSPEGETITLSAKGSERPGEVVISVTDRGPGLSAEDMDRLFGRFQQVSTSRNVAAKGFGLGLSIAQELSWLNLGTLSVASEKGNGATFSLTVPVNDPISVVQHYFDTIVPTEMLGDQLAIIHAEIDTSVHMNDPAEPREFLSSATYATDLVLPSPWVSSEDHTHAPHAWWIIGRTRSAERWLERLLSAREQLVADSTIALAPLKLDIRKVWNIRQPDPIPFPEVVQALELEHTHAT